MKNKLQYKTVTKCYFVNNSNLTDFILEELNKLCNKKSLVEIHVRTNLEKNIKKEKENTCDRIDYYKKLMILFIKEEYLIQNDYEIIFCEGQNITQKMMNDFIENDKRLIRSNSKVTKLPPLPIKSNPEPRKHSIIPIKLDQLNNRPSLAIKKEKTESRNKIEIKEILEQKERKNNKEHNLQKELKETTETKEEFSDKINEQVKNIRFILHNIEQKAEKNFAKKRVESGNIGNNKQYKKEEKVSFQEKTNVIKIKSQINESIEHNRYPNKKMHLDNNKREKQLYSEKNLFDSIQNYLENPQLESRLNINLLKEMKVLNMKVDLQEIDKKILYFNEYFKEETNEIRKVAKIQFEEKIEKVNNLQEKTTKNLEEYLEQQKMLFELMLYKQIHQQKETKYL